MQANLSRLRGARLCASSSPTPASSPAAGKARVACRTPTCWSPRSSAPSAPQDLRGERVLVTAGPNREPIDPVRFISNRSTGKMGFAVAAAAWRRGAEVTLVAGPTALPTPHGVRRVDVTTADEMRHAVRRRVRRRDASLFMAAAVADYRPAQVAPQKLKKAPGGLTLECGRARRLRVAKPRAGSGAVRVCGATMPRREHSVRLRAERPAAQSRRLHPSLAIRRPRHLNDRLCPSPHPWLAQRVAKPE